jgi:two-component system chemotaxis sensor kinase CheA
MTIDMSQFHSVFLEESTEHLDEIEHLLMSLPEDNPDVEDLNSIFRAAHSIKGGAGIFGFDALISVTHVMENLFDLARQGLFRITPAVVNELLVVVDILRRLLQSYGDGTAVDWQLVADATAKVEALLATPATPEQSDGFGFFEDATSAVAGSLQEDTGFGFFEPQAVKADDGFGFFEAPAEPTAGRGTEDDGFGFFPPESQLTAPAQTFADVATGPAQQQQAPAARPVVPAASVSNPSAQMSAAPQLVGAGAAMAEPKAASKSKTDHDAGTIRVDLHKVDSLVNLVGELVITQSMLTLIGEEITGPTGERLATALRELERNTRDLQEGIMSIRMLPMSFVFNRFPRVVRDLSQKLQKNVELVIEGGHTEIDKSLIEKLVDPLTHLVRNSLDHGIEAPAVRQQRGKAASGVLTLKAEQKGGNILISVMDDGAGLNREKIIAKARERGLDISDSAPDNEVWQLIMAPGFSTAEQVTDVSGRGVGMDVVRRNIESMGGKIEISSVSGYGSGMHIRLPLTLAIVDGMSVSVSNQQFIVPLVNIVESVQPSKEQITSVSNQQMLFLRDLYWPIVRLGELMALPDALTEPTTAILVLVESSKQRFAMLVDDLLGQQQVVIKSLEQHYRRVHGVAGATIMGDGSVALILDVESLAEIPTSILH